MQPNRARKPRPRCVECGKVSYRSHPILDIYLCLKCQRRYPEKYRFITKGRAMDHFRLKPRELAELGVFEADNPHYKKAAPMQLYVLHQVEELSRRKWGTVEPYIVQLVGVNDELMAWFLEDPERLKKIPEDRFEQLIAELLEARGFGVRLVGDTRRKDGGVDIVAWPEVGHPFPFLVAVQVKHHRVDRKTGAPSVRDLHGVVTSQASPFHIGMLVTNTAFSADAKWFAANNMALLRLRDLEDLRRWMRKDFNNEHEWREIPERIELAPGISVEIPKPKLWLP